MRVVSVVGVVVEVIDREAGEEGAAIVPEGAGDGCWPRVRSSLEFRLFIIQAWSVSKSVLEDSTKDSKAALLSPWSDEGLAGAGCGVDKTSVEVITMRSEWSGEGVTERKSEKS